MVSRVALLSLALASTAVAQTYTATYLPGTAPEKTEQGQTGTNRCGTTANQTSDCQNVYLNSIDDWCIWGPPESGPDSVVGNVERIVVAYCIKDGYGTRLIPDGTIKGAHFVQTPDFVQVTGMGDLTKINIPAGDAGGELDPHGADGNGNPIGGLLFSSAFGQLQQIHEWTNFISSGIFCIRACKPGPMAPTWCEHIYDVLGCEWNMPANYDVGTFESCVGDSGQPMGVYGTSKFFQGQPVTPPAHPRPASSSCRTMPTISNGVRLNNAVITTTSSARATATSEAGTTGSTGIDISSTGAASSTSVGSGSSAISHRVAAGWVVAFAGLLAGIVVVVL